MQLFTCTYFDHLSYIQFLLLYLAIQDRAYSNSAIFEIVLGWCRWQNNRPYCMVSLHFQRFINSNMIRIKWYFNQPSTRQRQLYSCRLDISVLQHLYRLDTRICQQLFTFRLVPSDERSVRKRSRVILFSFQTIC